MLCISLIIVAFLTKHLGLNTSLIPVKYQSGFFVRSTKQSHIIGALKFCRLMIIKRCTEVGHEPEPLITLY